MNEISKPSKGAEKILLAQIKQEFSAPAEAIEHYVDLVEQYANENNLNVSDEINQIKDAEKKLLSQYEEAFNENTSLNKEEKSSEEIVSSFTDDEFSQKAINFFLNSFSQILSELALAYMPGNGVFIAGGLMRSMHKFIQGYRKGY